MTRSLPLPGWVLAVAAILATVAAVLIVTWRVNQPPTGSPTQLLPVSCTDSACVDRLDGPYVLRRLPS